MSGIGAPGDSSASDDSIMIVPKDESKRVAGCGVGPTGEVTGVQRGISRAPGLLARLNEPEIGNEMKRTVCHPSLCPEVALLRMPEESGRKLVHWYPSKEVAAQRMHQCGPQGASGGLNSHR